MEIGGYDIIIQTDDSKELSERIKKFIDWKESVIEFDGDDYFWYKDQYAKNAWDTDIGEEDTMIYFIFEEKQLTVVADSKTALLIKQQFVAAQ